MLGPRRTSHESIENNGVIVVRGYLDRLQLARQRGSGWTIRLGRSRLLWLRSDSRDRCEHSARQETRRCDVQSPSSAREPERREGFLLPVRTKLRSRHSSRYGRTALDW